MSIQSADCSIHIRIHTPVTDMKLRIGQIKCRHAWIGAVHMKSIINDALWYCLFSIQSMAGSVFRLETQNAECGQNFGNCHSRGKTDSNFRTARQLHFYSYRMWEVYFYSFFRWDFQLTQIDELALQPDRTRCTVMNRSVLMKLE